MLRIFLSSLLLCLTACGSGHNTAVPLAVSSGWQIGPIVDGKNYSVGMPASPTLHGAGWVIPFPGPGGGVDAVENLSPPSLVGVKSITVHYSVTGSGFFAAGETGVPGRVGLCIQRRGDDWSGVGKYQQYRLYGTSRPLLVAGEGQFTASAWTDVKGQPVSQAVVDAVLAGLDNYAIVFGGSFASHGVYATSPATFTLVSVEPQ